MKYILVRAKMLRPAIQKIDVTCVAYFYSRTAEQQNSGSKNDFINRND